MICPSCQSTIETEKPFCPDCGKPLTDKKNPYAATMTEEPSPQAATTPTTGDATGGVIPYKNPKALLAYYLGILSGLPLIGFPIGIVAFVLGIIGLRDRSRNPVIKGSLHAMVGIGCGGIFAIFWGLIIVSVIISIIAG